MFGNRLSFLSFVLTCCLPFLVGCGPAGEEGKAAPPNDVAQARGDITLLQRRQFDQLEQEMSSDLQTPELPDRLSTMADQVPLGQPASVKLVDSHTAGKQGERTTSLTLEYEFPHTWLLADVTTDTRDGVRSITGFHVGSMPESLEGKNRFKLKGKTEFQYDTLIAGLLSLLLNLYAFVLCLRTRFIKRKWLWLISTLFGVGTFSMNLTTGRHAFVPISFHLPTAGAAHTPYGPWFVFVTFPVGAVIFLLLRNRLRVSGKNSRYLEKEAVFRGSI